MSQRVQSKDRRRDLHLSLCSNREAYSLQRWPLEPACLERFARQAPPLPSLPPPPPSPPPPPPLIHCGLNNIIKNDHQRAHCKQIILLGAWRTNSTLEAERVLQPCAANSSACSSFFFFFFSPAIYTHTHFSGHFPLV